MLFSKEEGGLRALVAHAATTKEKWYLQENKTQNQIYSILDFRGALLS